MVVTPLQIHFGQNNKTTKLTTYHRQKEYFGRPSGEFIEN
jgi:hypothetical protein